MLDYKFIQQEIRLNELCWNFFCALSFTLCVNLIDCQTWKIRASLIANYQVQNRPQNKKVRILSPLLYFLAGYAVVYIVWNLNVFSPCISSKQSSQQPHVSVAITITAYHPSYNWACEE